MQNNGRPMTAIPGPSVMPDRVLQAMHQPAPDIYGGRLEAMTEVIVRDLKAVARTQHDVALYISNGHGVWEASLVNVINQGDKVLSLASGRFGSGWADVAKKLGADVQLLDYGVHEAFDAEQLAAILADDKEHKIKALTTTHVDTSSSIKYDIPQIRKILDDVGHPALLMVDCIASLGCDRFEMDAWGVDVMIAACQKGLMTPPGMAFIFFNEKAKQAHANLTQVSPYWDWHPRTNPQVFYQYYGGTAPTHHLFGLEVALQMMIHEEGIENVWQRHETLAKTVWAAFDGWSEEGVISLNVQNPALRSHAVTTAKISGQMATPVREWLRDQHQVTLGFGLGMAPVGDPKINSYFRIGHMGHLNSHMVLGTLSSLEMGFKKFDIPHGNNGLANAMKLGLTL
jgi:alanine-glyoxylate transaminase/serine-glyoxylate transaminase/serine-pyruvate transaminase